MPTHLYTYSSSSPQLASTANDVSATSQVTSARLAVDHDIISGHHIWSLIHERSMTHVETSIIFYAAGELLFCHLFDFQDGHQKWALQWHNFPCSAISIFCTEFFLFHYFHQNL